MGRDKCLDWSVSQRLGIGFGAGGLLLVTLVAFSLIQLGHIDQMRRQRAEVVEPRASAADELEFALLDRAVSARSYALTLNPDELRAFENANRKVHGALAKFSALQTDPDANSPQSAEIPHLAARLDQTVSAFVRLAQSRAGPDQLRSAELELAQQRGELFSRVREYHVLLDRKDSGLLARIGTAQRQLEGALAALGLLALALFAVTAAMTVQSVRTPALELLAAARHLAAGDFASAARMAGPADRRFRDELRELSSAFGRMALALRDREERLAATARFAAEMAQSIQVPRLCEQGLRQLACYLEAEVGAVYVLSEDRSALECKAALAFGGKQSQLDVDEGIPGQVMRTRLPVVVRDIPADTPFHVRLGIDRIPPRTILAVPLDTADGAIGAMVLASIRELPADAVQFAQAAANQLAISVQNALGHARVEKLAAELQQKSEVLHGQNEELQAQQEEIQVQVEELHSQNEELQLQSTELQSVQNGLREVDARKNKFLAVLSHELRNPLAPIRNSLHILSKVPPGDPQASRALAVIERQARHLSRLVDDLLDLTRIAHGKVSLQRARVDLAQLIRQAADDSQALFQMNGIHLEVEVPEHCIYAAGDAVRLAQVVGNLLQNASKFTPPGGRVNLSLEADGEDGKAIIRVRDTGMGMEPEVLARLFEPFHQADASLARSRGGLGLGLALVKGLVELHGGSVRASSPGLHQGSEFAVELPLTAAQAGCGEVITQRGGVASAPRRVLIVEDNRDAAESLRDVLESYGHKVEVAPDGPLGLKKIHRFRPDVVLCDIGLPGMNGYEVAQLVRADASTRGTFLVALTGYSLPEDLRRAADAGFQEHLPKPPDIAKLLELLARVPSPGIEAEPCAAVSS
jgi:signal transduction histidine kinase/CHASE3 domain sensor protein/ActR/RegA family two-component response regulator